MDGFLVPLPTIRKGLYSKLATLNTFPFGQSDADTAELVDFRLQRISRNSKSKKPLFLTSETDHCDCCVADGLRGIVNIYVC